MPSQLSGTTSTQSSNNSYSVQINGTVDQGRSESFANDMQAAARTVGILAHSCNRKSESMVSSLQEVCRAGGVVSKPLCNGSTTPLVAGKNVEHNGHIVSCVWNGEACHNVPSPKTRGAASNQDSSETSHCDSGRLICPKEGVKHASGLVTKKVAELATKQKLLQERILILEQQVREKQLSLMSEHVISQATFVEDRDQDMSGTGETSVATDVERSASTVHLPFPIQVDGASDDAFLSQVSLPASDMFGGECAEVDLPSANCTTSRTRCDDSFSSLESCATVSSCGVGSSLVGEGTSPGYRAARCVKTQALAVAETLDPDLTDTSSDEEEVAEVESQQSRRTHLKHSWEKSRMAVGSRWMWLHRKIAELNKQIYLLDHHVKGACPQEQCVFGAHSLGILPLAAAKATALTNKHGSTNGFNAAGSSRSHLSYLQHFLLPEALLSSRLHVKDLLTPSPLGQNLLCLDEGASARTRPLLRRIGSRKIVRRKRLMRVRGGGASLDPAHHIHLSLPHELPSRILLDTVTRDMLLEHSYSQLPLSKRRKAASCLPQLSPPQMQPLDALHSSSPSPIHTPASLDSSRGQNRKKSNSLQQQISMESLSTASTLGGCGSPWSPGISRPTTPSLTPGLTPLASSRKKKMASSTPLFDIDNIVIPYSIASSTRLEKLEYKEIITPRWRKIDDVTSDQSPNSAQLSDPVEEDLSDDAFAKRHDRCELNEKKRFLNFISGNNHRRKTRPHSVTLSESPAGADVSLASPPPRRPTIASPTPTELELPRLPEVLPWQPRQFPLSGEDEDALQNPPPPPLILPSSPVRTLHTSTPSLSPSCTTSAYNTPLPSPLSTPVEDATPAGSPAEWVVNTQLNPASTGQSFVALHQLPRVLTSSPLPHHQPIILKLTKKT